MRLTDISLALLAQKAKAFWQASGFRRILPIFCLYASATGCVYRFTNQHVSNPIGVRNLAVEAVYDTSREVLPHEMLWESLQKAFAKDGHLRVTGQSEADALVRAHLKQASIIATGGNLENDLNPADNTVKTKDPAAFTIGPPPQPSQFRRLTQAGEYRNNGSVNTVVEVEVWNLNTRALLMRKVYPAQSGFQALHGGGSITTTVNDHLRYDEASRAVFQHMADNLAYDVVNSLLLH